MKILLPTTDADFCLHYYDTDRDVVVMEFNDPSRFFFEFQPFSDALVANVCKLALMKLHRNIEAHATEMKELCAQQEADRQDRVDAIISGAGMPMHWQYGQEKFWRELEEGMQHSFYIGEVERLGREPWADAIKAFNHKVRDAKPTSEFEGYLPRYSVPFSGGPFITGDTPMEEIKEMFKNPIGYDTKNNN